jgi:hypothetical protein
MKFSIIRGLFCIVGAVGGMGRHAPAPAQSVARHCAHRKKGQNKIAMKTVTPELVAIETVIVLGVVFLLGTVTVAWVMFGPSEHL